MGGTLTTMSVSARTCVDFDVATMPIDKNGIQQFFWPISAKEMPTFRDDLATALMPLLVSTPQMGPLLLASNHLIRHLMSIWQALELRNRLNAARVEPSIPFHAPLWTAILNDGVPPLPPLFSQLAASKLSGFSRLHHLRLGRLAEAMALIRDRRNPFYRDNFALHPYTRRLAQDRIVTTSPSEIVGRHALEIDEPVCLVRLEQWFRPVSEIGSAPNLVIAPVMDIIDTAFYDSGVTLNDKLREHISTCVGMFHVLVGRHLDRLRAAPRRLPRRLWTGTGGNLWSRILRQAVREAGGHATGHDHSIGSGYKISIGMGIVEFIACDRFVTTNQARAQALKLSASRPPLTVIPPPEIATLASRPAITPSTRPTRAAPDTQNRVMYVSTIYCGDTMHMDPHTPDIVMVDWQSRILAKLHKWGWDVLHKPHPEGQIIPPAAFADRFGVRTLAGLFENVIDQADIFLFDKINSTTFSHALAHSLPMVYVEIDDWDWIPQAWEALHKRTAVVKASRDPLGRIAIDWSELQEALDRSVSLADDRDFYESYVA